MGAPAVDVDGSGALQYLRAETAERREIPPLLPDWSPYAAHSNVITLPITIAITRLESISKQGFEARRMHQPHFLELLSPLDINGAPYASRLAGRQPNRVAEVVDAFSNPIDPAKTKRLVHHLRPGDTRPAGGSFVKANP